MSAVSTRPQVKSVSNPVIAAAVVGGAVLIGRVIRSVLADLSSPGRFIAAEADGVNRAGLVSPAVAREQWRVARSAPVASAAGLEPLDAAKAQALRAWSVTSFYVKEDVARSCVNDVVRAQTLEQLRAAEQTLLATATAQHQPIVVDGLTLACRQAAQAIGLTAIELVKAGGGVRMTAIDAGGSGIVSEIEAQPSGDITLATEVVHGDGRCHALLDAFELALERQGVRSDVPDRRSTGGVCELKATKDFVRRRLQPKVTPAAVGDGAERVQEEQLTLERRRRLNQRNRTKGQ